MNIDDFQFTLPPEQIAKYPAVNRTDSRLLQVSYENNEHQLQHGQFKDVLNLLEPGDLLVFNNTKVIPARFYGYKKTGGRVEVLVERLLDERRCLAQLRVSKPPKENDLLYFEEGIQFQVLGREGLFYELAYLNQDVSLLKAIEKIGELPLPPYMHRKPEPSDYERYQTVYAKHEGSVAAPTAGLHFDETLLEALKQKGVNMAHLMLHIGAGTFAPVRVHDIKTHIMHAEYIEVSEAVCEQIAATKKAGKRVVAVGTTTLRALESACDNGALKPFCGETSIFMYPGHTFHSADVLITNFHLPGSTLLMLVAAFGGYDITMAAYQAALKAHYRFYSYGDAMWIMHQIK